MIDRHPIHVLWAHPRSASTVFERLMRERGDLDCLHEPFLPDYYVARSIRSFPHFMPNPDHPSAYGDIRAMLLKRAEAQAVFIKDMAYYVVPHILEDDELLAAMRHVFLIRDPAPALLSYAKLDPEFTREEAGYEAQLALYRALQGKGVRAPVIRSEAFRKAPETEMRRYWAAAGLQDAPHAFSWDRKAPEDWAHVQGWHEDVLASGGVRKPEGEGGALAHLAKRGQRFLDIHAAVTPAYEALKAAAA